MSPGKINHVDEVTHGGSIRCVPIGPEDVQHGPSSGEDGGNNRDQVAWFLSRVLTQDPGFVAANLCHIRQSGCSAST
jgi:hypothetical protein